MCSNLDERFNSMFKEMFQKVLTKFIEDNKDDFPMFAYVRDAMD